MYFSIRHQLKRRLKKERILVVLQIGANLKNQHPVSWYEKSEKTRVFTSNVS